MTRRKDSGGAGGVKWPRSKHWQTIEDQDALLVGLKKTGPAALGFEHLGRGRKVGSDTSETPISVR